MTDPVMFTVVGKPEPAGSKKAFMRPGARFPVVVDDNAKSKPWKKTVATTALGAMMGRTLLTGPLALSLDFVVLRPKGHFGTGRNADVVKDSAPPWPVVKPDVLKLARAVEDALTGVVWVDDAQIVAEALTKSFGSRHGVRVVVKPVLS